MSNEPINSNSRTKDLSDQASGNDQRLHEQLAQLLANAGPRTTAPPRLQAEVRAAVHAEWRHIIATRKAQRSTRWLAVAALLLAMVGSALFIAQRHDSAPAAIDAHAIIADIEQAERDATLNAMALDTVSIHLGDTLRTHAGGMRLTLSNGIRMRIAANSTLQFIAVGRVQLDQGQVYVDSNEHNDALVIDTPHGQVSHLGTRYFVDSEAQLLRVAVRSGRIAIRTDDSQLTVNAMEQLQLRADRQIVRSELNLQDGSWQWADALAKPFVLENRSVAEFVNWVATETGYQLRYANRAVQTAADSTILHGQQTTLPPLQSLTVVLATTDFHASMQGRQLLISQP